MKLWQLQAKSWKCIRLFRDLSLNRQFLLNRGLMLFQNIEGFRCIESCTCSRNSIDSRFGGVWCSFLLHKRALYFRLLWLDCDCNWSHRSFQAATEIIRGLPSYRKAPWLLKIFLMVLNLPKQRAPKQPKFNCNNPSVCFSI